VRFSLFVLGSLLLVAFTAHEAMRLL